MKSVSEKAIKYAAMLLCDEPFDQDKYMNLCILIEYQLGRGAVKAKKVIRSTRKKNVVKLEAVK